MIRFLHIFRILAVLGLLCSCIGSLSQAAEDDEFIAAAQAFKDGFYERAARELAAFAEKYPQTTRSNEVTMLRAEALTKSAQPDQVIALLANFKAPETQEADRLFWLGQAQLEKGNYLEAANLLTTLARAHTNYARVPHALYSAAVADFRRGAISNAVATLNGPESPLQKTAASRGETNLIFRGQLLLSEAFLQQTNVSAALAVLGSLTNQVADPALLWQREQLLGEVRLQAKDPVALQSATNLLNLSARLPNAVERRHEGLRFQARVHLALGQAAQGAAVLGRIANDQAFTPAQRKSGLLESVGIFINQQQFTNAAAQLEAFLQANPADPASGELRLALADVYLQNFTALRKQADPPVAPLTNLLSLAGAQLDLALTNLSSTNLAEARLKRGWTHWESHTIAPSDARLSNALENFEAAAQLAPKTLTGVVGLHKAADCRFLLGQLAGAITNYSQVVAALDTVPGVKSKLGTEAFYQLARAHLQLTNVAAAGEVSEQMLHLFPSDPLTSQARLLYVSALLSGGRSAEARTIVTNLLARVPSESALPEARLALARTYQEQGAWTNALQEYEDWLGRYTNHTLRPFVEFDWAWLTLQAGNATNAYHLFTNFVARYPRDPLAPRAQTLVANYHYNLEQWVPAEQNYQRIFQNTNWPPSAEKWQAHLMAARAAFFRQNYNDAVEYVTRLIDTKETPTNILGEAFFLLGDIILERPVATTNALQNFSEAIKAFSTIPQRFPKHPLTPLAWGKVGDCYYQYASQSPDDYARATNAYWNVLTNSAAPVVAICQANVGIGDVLEKMSALTTNRAVRLSLQRQALDFHLNVIYGKGLNGEPADPYWLGRAATGAARLAEAVGQPGQAVELYQRLIQLIPSRGPYYQTRIQALTKSG